MFEDEQKLRLLVAAAKLQDIIATIEIDLEHQTLIDLYGSSIKTLQDEVPALEDANAKPQVAGNDTLLSQPDDRGDLFTSLNKTINDIGKFVVQINNNLNLTREYVDHPTL